MKPRLAQDVLGQLPEPGRESQLNTYASLTTATQLNRSERA
jgi:hypothetical protein